MLSDFFTSGRVVWFALQLLALFVLVAGLIKGLVQLYELTTGAVKGIIEQSKLLKAQDLWLLVALCLLLAGVTLPNYLDEGLRRSLLGVSLVAGGFLIHSLWYRARK